MKAFGWLLVIIGVIFLTQSLGFGAVSLSSDKYSAPIFQDLFKIFFLGAVLVAGLGGIFIWDRISTENESNDKKEE